VTEHIHHFEKGIDILSNSLAPGTMTPPWTTCELASEQAAEIEKIKEDSHQIGCEVKRI